MTVLDPNRNLAVHGRGYTLNPSYQVRLIDKNSGLIKAIFDSWRILYFGHRVNSIGWYQFAIDGTDDRKELFGLDDFIEIWRADPYSGIDWYREMYAMHRTSVHLIFDNGNTQYTSYGRTSEDLLNRRIIGYQSGDSYSNKSGPADDVMKEFVLENAGSSATSPPRLKDGVIQGLSVQAKSRGGTTWQGGRSGESLLNVLQNIAESTNVDFNLVPTDYGEWEFRTYANQLGTDRTLAQAVANALPPSSATTTEASATPQIAPVIFSVARGNMSNPSLSYNRTEEVTRVFVWGPGEEDDRLVAVVDDDLNIESSPWNTLELSVSANGQDTSSELISLGQETLYEKRARFDVNFSVLQQMNLIYGRDYFLGDRVSCAFPGVTEIDTVVDKKIIAVTINVSGGDEGNEGRENVEIELADTIRRYK